jgi:hypothetical protein
LYGVRTLGGWPPQQAAVFCRFRRAAPTHLSCRKGSQASLLNAYSANATPIEWKYSDPTAASPVTLSLPNAPSSSQIVIVMRYVNGPSPESG